MQLQTPQKSAEPEKIQPETQNLNLPGFIGGFLFCKCKQQTPYHEGKNNMRFLPLFFQVFL
ncbi:MAG TPA: hypothetical protein ACHBX0_14100, partial [Arsenophonus sp.]